MTCCPSSGKYSLMCKFMMWRNSMAYLRTMNIDSEEQNVKLKKLVVVRSQRLNYAMLTILNYVLELDLTQRILLWEATLKVLYIKKYGCIQCNAKVNLQLSVQFSSVTQLCLTLCNVSEHFAVPMDCSMAGLPVHHQLPFTQTHVH